MFCRENGAAIAWLLLFVLMVGGAVYDRASDRSSDRSLRSPDGIVALR
jgi:hypothetical protein